MGRPSLSTERRQEILDAFGRCVAKYGIAGSSLERIAEEAGMTRSILRHYIGNRNQLIDALAEKVILDYREYTRIGFASLTSKNRSRQLVNLLLPNEPVGTTEQLLVIEGLIGVSHEHPEVRKLVFEYIDDYIQLIADQLKQISPKTPSRKCWDTAYGLVCISFNQESLQPLELPAKYLKAARNVASGLIAGLTG